MYQGLAEKHFLVIYLQSKALYQKENWGLVCILLSNGTMKLTHLHLNPTFMLFALSSLYFTIFYNKNYMLNSEIKTYD